MPVQALSLPSVRICAATPTTRPPRSSTGPPELPWLIAASVWITPGVVKSVAGASISRFSAATTPTDSDCSCSSPNGEPITASGSPTLRSRGLAELSTVSGSRVGSIFSTAMSSNRSYPTSFAGSALPSWKCTKKSRPALTLALESAPWSGESVTTCAFVSTWPSDETTKPEPSTFSPPTTALIVTTPADAAR